MPRALTIARCLLPVACCLFLALGPTACSGGAPRTVIRFDAKEAPLLNPERGIVVDVDLVAGGDFSYVREQGATLGFAAVRLDEFRDAPLSDELLEALDRGFAAARDAGIKVIVRFVYNRDAGGADASRERIFEHIWQLHDTLWANLDVIAVVDAGFIGAWGEWHTSIHNLDNPEDRSAILGALLAAVPASRSVIIRSPAFKQEMFGGPLTPDTAFRDNASRVGHLNGCFLASDSDEGTYPEPIEQWKDFVAAEGRFVPVGGETCRPNPPRSDCPTARAELARMHWSFLNSLYHPQVLAAWQDQDCYDEIADHLGYRLEVEAVSFEEKLTPGGPIRLRIELRNTGYAAMFNARPVFVMIDDIPFETDLDPRRWAPGPITIARDFALPEQLAPGPHRLGLWLPDAAKSLRDHPEYAVRFANARWDRGVNWLTDALIVTK